MELRIKAEIKACVVNAAPSVLFGRTDAESGVALCEQTTVSYRRALSSPPSLTFRRPFRKFPILTTSRVPSNGFLHQLRHLRGCNLGLDTLIGASSDIGTPSQCLVTRASVTSPLYLWHANRNPVPANECAENLWQEHHSWLIACWCRTRIKRLGTFVEKDRECERDCRKYSARNLKEIFLLGRGKGLKKKKQSLVSVEDFHRRAKVAFPDSLLSV